MNHELAKTSKSCSLSIHVPRAPRSTMYWVVFCSLSGRCGSRAPGIAAAANRNSSMSAVFIDVSERHNLVGGAKPAAWSSRRRRFDGVGVHHRRRMGNAAPGRSSSLAREQSARSAT